MFVQRPVYEEFLARFIKSVEKLKVGDPMMMMMMMTMLKVGDPMDEDTFCGAVNSRVHYDKVMFYIRLIMMMMMIKVMSYIRLAQEDAGARLHTGEGVSSLSLAPHNKRGFFIQPTIITGVDDDHRLLSF